MARKDLCLGYSLDRLFLLIDSSSSLELRQKAAEQLCEISRLNKRDYYLVVLKLFEYLISNSSDTRSVAAFCLDLVLSAAKRDQRGGSQSRPDDKYGRSDRCFLLTNDRKRAHLRIREFDFAAIKENSANFLGSGKFGEDALTKNSAAQSSQNSGNKGSSAGEDAVESGRVSKGNADTGQVELNGGFPIDMNQSIRVICSEFASFDDLKTDDAGEECLQTKSSFELQTDMFGGSQYAVTVGDQNETVEDCIDSKRMKLDVEEGSTMIRDMRDFLYENAFHHRWERRHGALLGLKLFVKNCLPASDWNNKRGQTTSNHSDNINLEDELEDLIVRLLCLLMVDRFADYVSDEVSAPVRQECSELIAFCCAQAQSTIVKSVLQVLSALLSDNRWELRHASLLCYQHILPSCETARYEASKCVTSILPAFDDNDIDVVSAASCCFLSIVDTVVKHLGDQLDSFVTRLESTLRTFDNVCTSSSLIVFITKLVPKMDNISLKGIIIDDLYRCLLNMNSHIRTASVNCIETIVLSTNTSNDGINPYLEPSLRWIFSCVAIETNVGVLNHLYQSWKRLILSARDRTILCSSLERMMHFLLLPLFCPEKAKTCQAFIIHGNDQTSVDIERCPSDEQLTMGARAIDLQYTRNRVYSARCVSYMLLQILTGSPDASDVNKVEEWIRKIFMHVNFNSANHRIGLCILFIELVAQLDKTELDIAFPPLLRATVQDLLGSPIVFDELSTTLAALHRSCGYFVKQLVENTTVTLPEPVDRIYTAEVVQEICQAYEKIPKEKFPDFDFSRTDGLRDSMSDVIQNCKTEQEVLNIRSTALASALMIHLCALSEKLNPIIKPLMESIRRDSNYQLQEYSAGAMAKLIQQTLVRQLRPYAKIIKNLTNMLCLPASVVPRFDELPINETYEAENDVFSRYTCSRYRGIITVAKEENEASSDFDMPVGDFFCERSGDNDFVNESDVDNLIANPPVEPSVACRGAELTLKAMCDLFGPDLLLLVHELKDQCLSGLNKFDTIESVKELETHAQEIINSMRLLEVLIKFMDDFCIDQIFSTVIENLCLRGLSCRLTAVRHISARCVAALMSRRKEKMLEIMERFIVPGNMATSSKATEASLQGAIECIYCIITLFDSSIVQYAPQLCVPVLRMTSHQDWFIRLLANRCFATLVKLHPLQTIEANEHGATSTSGHFFDILLNPSKLGEKALPKDLQVDLRPYQQEGVNWLYFLRDYNLNGILCDDMGLGKTLQTLCLLVGTCLERKKEGLSSIPSLVVCPSTVTHHWIAEIDKFFCKLSLHRVAYIGTLSEREKMQRSILSKAAGASIDVIVTSYDTLRNDIAFLSQIQFLFMVLDEGHVIRSSKTKLSRAIRRISSNHRLILSGTPVQNNVSELWNLFNFLMPGYLGTEKQFNARYRKPVVPNRDQKFSRDQENGIIALGALHKQVLPFMLRRLKQDVLSCLPPKIVQYYYCELTALQASLYDDFCVDQEKAILEGLEVNEGTHHIFKALRYLKKLCNHPMLVCNEEHPRWPDVQTFLKNEKIDLKDIRNSGKLLALRELLVQCGVGDDSIGINQKHRILIFCQMKSMIELVQNTVLKEMDGVKYLCLDGSVPQSKRFDIVQKFNRDQSIDVLLLTTQVGGLGLSLTGADVVIFVEHDWNPTKDLQAMDRAHRLGQTRTVNVYRLVTKGTLEEKIMNMQKFKIDVANTVVSSENSSTATMDSSVFELYSLRHEQSSGKSSEPAGTSVDATDRWTGEQLSAPWLQGEAQTPARDLLQWKRVSSLLESMEERGDEGDSCTED